MRIRRTQKAKQRTAAPPLQNPAVADFIPVVLDNVLRITRPRDVILPRGPLAWMHYHDCMELGRCYSGTGVMVVNQRVLRFGPGDVVLVWPGQFHMGWTLEGSSAWKFLNFDASAAPVDRDIDLPPLPRAEVINQIGFEQLIASSNAEFSALAMSLFNELEAQPPGHAPVVRSLLTTLVIWLRRACAKRAVQKAPFYAASGFETLSKIQPAHAVRSAGDSIVQLQPALTRIGAAYSEPLSVSALADLCCMSERTFRRAFYAALGAAPLEYLLRLRVNTACALLSGTDLPISKIAGMVGYPQPSDFSRQFRKTLDVTPKTYRERHPRFAPAHT